MNNLSTYTIKALKNGQLSGQPVLDEVCGRFTLVTFIAKNPRNREIQYHAVLDNENGINIMAKGCSSGKSYRTDGQYTIQSGRMTYNYDPRVFAALKAEFGNRFDYIAVNSNIVPQAGVKSNKKDWIEEGTSFDYTLNNTSKLDKRYAIVDVEELSETLSKIVIKDKRSEKLFYNIYDSSIKKQINAKPVPVVKDQLTKLQLVDGVSTPVAYKLAKMLSAAVYMFAAATPMIVK